ncbi:MFS transporter [Streptomyces sp. NPDC002769]|uniref:MFS transporter n=1 Tax=Streptomyces sp. NPDC002769 TaxID=3154542 RepID=UPI003332BA44
MSPAVGEERPAAPGTERGAALTELARAAYSLSAADARLRGRATRHQGALSLTHARALRVLAEQGPLSVRGGDSALAANLIAVLLGLGMFAFFTVVAGYAQVPSSADYGVGASTLPVGLFLLPCGLAMIALTPLAGRLTLRIGAAATVALGSLIVDGAFAWLLLRPGDAVTLWVGSVLFGLGYSALGTMAIQDIPEEHTSVVSGINGLMRAMGRSLPGAVTSLIHSTHLDRRTGQPTPIGYHTVFTVLGIVCVAAAALAVSRTRTGRHGRNNPRVPCRGPPTSRRLEPSWPTTHRAADHREPLRTEPPAHARAANRHPGRAPHSTRRLRPSHVCAMTTTAKKAPLTTCW